MEFVQEQKKAKTKRSVVNMCNIESTGISFDMISQFDKTQNV